MLKRRSNLSPKNRPLSIMLNRNTLWIDGVGGYEVYDQPDVCFGGRGCRSAPIESAMIEIVSDIPKIAFSIRYVGEDYLIQPFASSRVEVNGQAVLGVAILSHGDEIKVCNSVVLAFSKPSALSDTAVLRITSRHRWNDSIDGVVLFRSLCVLGPTAAAHLNCKYWSGTLTLFRQGHGWRYRLQANSPIEHSSVRSGESQSLPVAINQRIQGDNFSITIT
jgi:hypothetical protein